jgi:hypothetical protein
MVIVPKIKFSRLSHYEVVYPQLKQESSPSSKKNGARVEEGQFLTSFKEEHAGKSQSGLLLAHRRAEVPVGNQRP